MKLKVLKLLSLSMLLLGTMFMLLHAKNNYWGRTRQQLFTMYPTLAKIEINNDDFTAYNADEYDRFITTAENALHPSTLSEIRLLIPTIGMETQVYKGNSEKALKEGIWFYNQSGLPDEKNANVCIAGHRDVYGAEFYSIDKLTSGDTIILEYKNNRYVYNYESTTIVESDDGSILQQTNSPCITIVSCHPIGTSQKRIVVRGLLETILVKDTNKIL